MSRRIVMGLLIGGMFVLACSQQSPVAPSGSTHGTSTSGTLTAMASNVPGGNPSTVPVPGGPGGGGGGGVPGGPGSGGGGGVPGGNPSTAPVPGAPGFNPGPGGGGGTPGPGGGGGGSPSPSPSPSGSPTVPCPTTLTLNATGTPKLLSAATDITSPAFPQITTNYPDTCVVKDVKVTVYLTTVTGFVATPTNYTSPSLSLGVCGSGVTFGGCSSSTLYSFNFTATGNSIGTTCGDVSFDTTATTVFNPAAPPPAPYSGTYELDPARTGVGDKWLLRDLQYDLEQGDHPPDTSLRCARIVITTQFVAGPPVPRPPR